MTRERQIKSKHVCDQLTKYSVLISVLKFCNDKEWISSSVHRLLFDYSLFLSLLNIFLCREYISSCTLITANFSYIPIASSFEFSNISIDRPCCCFVLIAPFFFPDTSLRPRPSYHQVVDYAFPPFFSPSLLFFFSRVSATRYRGGRKCVAEGRRTRSIHPSAFISTQFHAARARQETGKWAAFVKF